MEVIRVAFKKVGKRYFFKQNNLNLNDGDAVVVETIRGIELGHVIGKPLEIKEGELEVKPILRKATSDDLASFERNLTEAKSVINKTKEEVKKLKLEMKILEAEFTLDHLKLIIYFEAEGRIDFRELVRVLAEIYHVRIELRQVGSRDGTKVFGGLGPCGMVVCCNTFITEFDTITVKMAKNQNLALNPAKISGNCGKLLCCIAYEDSNYKELRKNFPNPGDYVEAPEGRAKVLASDPLNRTMKVKYTDEPDKFGFYKIDEVKFNAKGEIDENGDN